jgi:hypothetical protein
VHEQFAVDEEARVYPQSLELVVAVHGRAHVHSDCDVDVYNARCHDAGPVIILLGVYPRMSIFRRIHVLTCRLHIHRALRRVGFDTIRAARLSCFIADGSIRRAERRHAGSSCTLLEGQVTESVV